MCAAVNSSPPPQVTLSHTHKNNRTSGGRTFLCCSPCCFGLSKDTKTSTTTYKPAAKSNNHNSNENNTKAVHNNNPFIGGEPVSSEEEENSVRIEDVGSNNLKASATTSASFPSRQLVNTTSGLTGRSPSTSSCPCPPLSPSLTTAASNHPAKLGFLVSFLVDARGGAMKGHRGSGMRLIIPKGAVEHPTRVTCRYLRGVGDRLPFPPPLMERESLASRVIEMGPSTAQFKVPVLLEVPHFASVRGGERELIVLRCDDGETWREHTTAYLQTGWQGGDEEIYADFVASTGITAAYQELDTSRVVRISCSGFPKYFAILSRIKEEVRAIGADGGKIVANHAPNVQVYFPSGALQKKIKVALQVQTIPSQILKLTCPTSGLKFSPLVAIEPRRRRFHNPIEVAIPLSAAKDPSRVRLLCSLAANSTPKALFEDVTEMTPITLSKGSVIFESKVSALFWAVYLEEFSAEVMSTVVPSAQYLYEELMLTPYMARFVVLHKPHSPHAWCDSLRVICVTDDKAEAWGDSSANHAWTTLMTSDEMEITAGSHLTCHLEGGIVIAEDCQTEFGCITSLDFKPFESNFATLLVRARKSHPTPNLGHLIIKKAFGHITENHLECLTTINLDLRDDSQRKSPKSHSGHCESEDYEDLPNIDDDVEEENGGKIQNGTEPTTTAINEIKMKKNENENENVIQVKEYSSPKDDDNDIVFVKLPS